VFGKKYCDLDFTAIKRLRAIGVCVCFLSGDETVNKEMAKTRKIPFFHSPSGTDKVGQIPLLRSMFGHGKMAYVGDDYYDIAMMNSVSMSFCPRTSPLAVQRSATHVVPVDAGKGVIAGILDIIEHRMPFSFPKDSPDVNPK
jgi:3-deoxy-D-manno-octulosonate 8-phosphate phosphatase KdsC-like HAD superfamily phosphatase